MISISPLKTSIDLLEASDIGSSVSRGSLLEDKRKILVDMKDSSFTEEDIKKFKNIVREWYPFYENFGEKKVYPESSIFWRILTYIPYLKNISGFDSFEKLGKDAAKKDIDNLSKFLKEDILKKIEDFNKKILQAKITTENKRNSI